MKKKQSNRDRFRFKAPVFIVSAPRSGSTLLFNLLCKSPGVWSIGRESHGIYAQFPQLRAEDEVFTSGRLGELHAGSISIETFKGLYFESLIDRKKRSFDPAGDLSKIKLLEKTPRNALNIPFLLKVFPDAKFILLHRDPKENISSIIEGWERGAVTGQFVTFKNLPGWDRGQWCFLLPPGWQDYCEASIAEIAAFQWQSCNEIMLDDLSRLDKNRWVSISYQRLIDNPSKQVERLCRFCGVGFDEEMQTLLTGPLPLSKTVVTKPEAGKWKRHKEQILPLVEKISPTAEKLSALKR